MLPSLDQMFGTSLPLTTLQQQRLDTLQKGFLHLAQVICANTPSVPEQEEAVHLLEKAYLAAQAAARRPRSVVSPSVLASRVFNPVEVKDDKVVRIWLNACDFADVRKYGSEIFKAETSAESFRKGFQGTAWGAAIYTSRKIPVGYALPVGSVEGDADLEPDWVPDPTKLLLL